MNKNAKKLTALALSTMMTLSAVGSVFAENQTAYQTTAQISPQFTINIDNTNRTFYDVNGNEVQPILYNGTTYLPVRAIGEIMGQNVNWDQETLTVTISGNRTTGATVGTEDDDAVTDDVTVDIRPDFTIVVNNTKQNFTDVNGDAVYPMLYNGSTYLPIRAIGKLMNKTVEWDGDTQTVYLYGTSTDSDSLVTDADSFNSTANNGTNNILPNNGINNGGMINGNMNNGNMINGGMNNGGMISGQHNGQLNGQHNGQINGQVTTPKTTLAPIETITLDEAITIALTDADLTVSDVTFSKQKLTRDDNIYVYEIKFNEISTNDKYEYKINASTGDIIERDIDNKDYGIPETAVTKEQAITIALAEVSGATSANITDAGKAIDDGIIIYEIEITYDNVKYEFTINANTGAIIDSESDAE